MINLKRLVAPKPKYIRLRFVVRWPFRKTTVAASIHWDADAFDHYVRQVGAHRADPCANLTLHGFLLDEEGRCMGTYSPA